MGNHKIIKIGVLMAVCAGFYACTASSRHASPADEWQGSAAPYYYHAEALKKFLVERDPDQAAELLQCALRADSGYAPAYYLAAKILLERNRAAEALPLAAEARRLDSANLTYASQLAAAMLMTEHYDDALQLYSELVARDPNNPMNYRLLAALYDYSGQRFTAISVLDTAEVRLGRIEELSAYKRELLVAVRLYEKALEESRKLVDEYPYDDENYRILGDIYNAMGRDSLALHNYGEALRLDSANVSTLYSLASFYHQRNDNRNYIAQLRRIFDNTDVPLDYKKRVFEELTSNLDFYRNNYFSLNLLISTLVTLYPDDYSVVDMYATHLIRGGETERGLELYKSFVRLQPRTLDAYRNILVVETHLMRPDSVTKYSDLALHYFPDSFDILIDKSYAQMRMQHDESALTALQDALKRAGNDSVRVTLHAVLGDLNSLAGNDRAALKHYRKALRRSSDPLEKSLFAGILADTYYASGDTKHAFALYRKALKYDPDNAMALNNYAYFLCESDKALERALEMSVRANSLSSNNPTYLDTQGWILYKIGRVEEAKGVMQRAVSLDMESAEALFHYAEILYAMGDTFMARLYWQRASEKGFDAAAITERLEMTANK